MHIRTGCSHMVLTVRAAPSIPKDFLGRVFARELLDGRVLIRTVLRIAFCEKTEATCRLRDCTDQGGVSFRGY